ncbi:BZ3500_MvSof-1268-A1-R1_Chr1-3g01693 [Microbotryum saponariae]|uniref:BZ3500_MvSof-1268-A1-R1_Chr1-3g01693 protein n=1 Tax=Microbotryum saponariae TaxID=289078 RepID=A0A2X0L2Z6_9BASI|nr:BZ3500_MvSof-1268-A1-R1_Chr1-3g01693 [Microbotryum saponariae]
MATPSQDIHSTSHFPNIFPAPTNPSPPTAEPPALHPTPTPPPAVASPQGVRRRFQFQPPPLGVGIGVVADVVRARALAQGNFELGSRDQQQEREKSDNTEWNRNERLSQLDQDEAVRGQPERGSDSTQVSPSLTEPNRRKRSTGSTEANLDLWKRLPYAEGYCNYVDNSILTCYPQSNTTLVQSVWSKVIFNAQYPLFIGSGGIDAYLYRADSETLATSYLGIETARGMFAIRPDDDWWPVNQTSWVEGTNQTWRYYFVVVSNGTKLNGGETHQRTFRAVQTAAPSTLISSLSSLSASASAASASASANSAGASPSPNSLSSGPKSTSPTPTSNNLQQPYPGPSLALPSWAIALIVSLGVLIVLLLVILGLVRKRRRRGTREWFSRSRSKDKDEEGKEDSGERTPSLSNECEGGEMVEGDRSGGTSSLTPITTSIATKAPRRSLISRPRPFTSNQDYQAVRGGPGSRKMQDPTVVGLLSPVDAEIITKAFKDELRRPEAGEEDDSEGYAGRE